MDDLQVYLDAIEAAAIAVAENTDAIVAAEEGQVTLENALQENATQQAALNAATDGLEAALTSKVDDLYTALGIGEDAEDPVDPVLAAIRKAAAK